MQRSRVVKVASVIWVLSSTVWCEASPDADPDADPEAMPQLWGGSGMESMMPANTLPAPIMSSSGSISVGGGGGGGMVEMMPSSEGLNCGMVDQCCGMADQGCCMNQGQQCYTQWKQECRYANKPVCQTQTREFCDTHPIKECRFTKKPEYVNVPGKKCTPRTERKCFKYTGKSCKPTSKPYNATFTWTNDNLRDGAKKPVEKCHNVKTCQIKETMKTGTRKQQKRECQTISVPRKQCRSVQVPQPPITNTVMDYETRYTQRCYNVPKPVCRMEPCSYQVQTQNICPTCITPGQPSASCGDSCGGGTYPSANPCVGPSCGGGVGITPDMCGACRQQNVQMCTKMTQKCEMTTEQVCQQVPIRIPVPRQVQVQPPPKWEMKCDMIPEEKQQCKTVYVDVPYSYPVKHCEAGTEEKCYNYEIPDQTVEREPVSESVQFPSTDCEVLEEEKEYCTQLPTDLVCRDVSERRGVLIRQRVCDRVRQARYCNILPFSYCQNNPGQECTTVPHEVCQPTCQQSNYCNQCTQFAGQGGFSQCSTSTCPNFYSPAANCPPGSFCY